MMSAALAHRPDADLSPQLAELLHAGIADKYGFVCLPGQVEKNWKHLREGERAGYIRFINLTHPKITDQGRAAIGALSEREEARAETKRICVEIMKRMVLDPTKREDPRTDFDYRSYKTMGYVCTLAFRQQDNRPVKNTVRVGRTLNSDPQFLGSRNSFIQPESTERFVVAVVPDWMTRPIKKPDTMAPAIFTTYPLPLDETDPAFTAEDRAEWERLIAVCHSINSRIRRAEGKAAGKKFLPVWNRRRSA